MKFIFSLFEKGKIKSLNPNDFHPSDKMAIEPVKRLFSKTTTDSLQLIIDEIRRNINTSNKNQLEEQIKKIYNVIMYLSNLGPMYTVANYPKLDNIENSWINMIDRSIFFVAFTVFLD
ncbi:hypothetical protein ACTFIW_012124 [Dictyostelium discoideum]